MGIKNVEQLFIGSILKNPMSMATLVGIEKDLKEKNSILAFRACNALFLAKKPINIMTVAVESGIEKLAGWLSEADDLGIGCNVPFYSQVIKEERKKERILAHIKALASEFENITSDDALDSLREIYGTELSEGSESGTIHEAMAEFEAQSEKYRLAGNIGISTGFVKWDREYITYEPGHLWGVGGFTSVGKTATALELIGRIGHNKGIAIFSMEMTKPQIISRMLSRITGHSSRMILAGKILSTDVSRAKEYLSSLPIHIFRRTRNWKDIANQCRVLKMRGEIDIAVFDYQQNISAEGKSTHDKMETISRNCQDVMQDLEITGIMLSQISLQQNREDSGAPEFKGGGGLAECCDVALHLSRPKTSKTELLVDMRKNRHGPKVPLLLEYEDNYTRLEEIG